MGKNNTISSVSLEFIRTIQDFSQYISHQRVLGNAEFILSQGSRETMNSWGKPRKNVPPFFSQGPKNASIFFVDSEGSFFNGESGALLVKILKAMQLTPESVFICNALDAASIRILVKKNQPKILITLGQRAGQLLLNPKFSLEQFRGKFHSYDGVQLMPTFHPSTLLEQPGLKRKVWEDMQQVMRRVGLSP
ncbi:MAG: uracil-DNA glycosylase [Desulfobacteraceae bacterium]|nr:uracil-DNA glycosylase [Desulfobacteraceae bacterium]